MQLSVLPMCALWFLLPSIGASHVCSLVPITLYRRLSKEDCSYTPSLLAQEGAVSPHFQLFCRRSAHGQPLKA